MVPVFVALILCIRRGASCFKVLPCSFCSYFFIPFSIVITSLGEGGVWGMLVYLLLVHLFVCFAHVRLRPFSLPLGVGGWLRFVIVAIYIQFIPRIHNKCFSCTVKWRLGMILTMIIIYTRNKYSLSNYTKKPMKSPVSPAKTQISLGIRLVWSKSSLSAWRNLGSLAIHWAHTKDYDQTGRMPRLSWVFAGRTSFFFFFFFFVMLQLILYIFYISKTVENLP